MDQHQVDIIGVESPQAAFRALGDVSGGGIAPDDGGIAHHARIIVEYEAHLGHEHDVLAALAQAAREQLLGREGSVDLGRIKEGNAVVDRYMHGAHSFVHIDLAVLRRAQLPGAEADGGCTQIGLSEVSLFHADSPFRAPRVRGGL